MGKSAIDLGAYTGVESSTVEDLRLYGHSPSEQKPWFAAVRAIVRHGGGYDIGPYEDLHRRFATEDEARQWIAERTAEIERLNSLYVEETTS